VWDRCQLAPWLVGTFASEEQIETLVELEEAWTQLARLGSWRLEQEQMS
jgi:hypothetical protein